MNNLDPKLIGHIGVEIVVIGGITFYFSKQIKDLNSRIDNLEKQNEFFRQAFETHETYLKQLYGGRSIPQPKQIPKQKRPQKRPQKQPSPPISDNDDESDESDIEFNEEELDEELEEEYQELNCDNDSCSLKDNKSNKYAKRQQ